MTHVVEVCPVCVGDIEMIHFGDHDIKARCLNKDCDWIYDSSQDYEMEVERVPFNRKRTYTLSDGRKFKFENKQEDIS